MKRDIIFKCLKYFSICFIIVIVIEIIDFILFSTIIELNLGIYNLNIITLIFTSGFISVEAVLEWLILLATICGFLMFGIVLLIMSFKKKFEDTLLAKFIILIGMFFLISGLIKTFSIYFLANCVIQYDSTTIIFQTALYTGLITSPIGAVMWIYFLAVSVVVLTSGLIFGGVGLKSLLNTDLKSKGR
ncbi:MAG: hypothetical protein ACFFGP_10645 [Promethearchaeota archaeon]